MRQSLRFKCKRSPLTLKGKKKPKPAEPTGARGVPRRSLYNFQGRESFQRSEGTYGRDRAPRPPARAGTSLCPLPLTALSPILYLHEAFLGEGRKSQLRSLHKNSLMESSRDNRRQKSLLSEVKNAPPKSEDPCSPRDDYILGSTLPAMHQETKSNQGP